MLPCGTGGVTPCNPRAAWTAVSGQKKVTTGSSFTTPQRAAHGTHGLAHSAGSSVGSMGFRGRSEVLSCVAILWQDLRVE